jgi:hypothetical protein
LQQLLVSLTVEQVSGCENEPYGIEHFVLLGVRFDAILVDLVNLMHGYLYGVFTLPYPSFDFALIFTAHRLRNRNGPGVWSESEDDSLLSTMRLESELRIRKCLKLSSCVIPLPLSFFVS